MNSSFNTARTLFNQSLERGAPIAAQGGKVTKQYAGMAATAAVKGAGYAAGMLVGFVRGIKS